MRSTIPARDTPCPESLRGPGRLLAISSACLMMMIPLAVGAQELVPAAYTPAPFGINLVTLTSTLNSGDLAFDPAGPIDEANADIVVSALTYARTLRFAGRSANVGISLPYLVGDLEGLYLGEPASAHRSGLGDASVKFAVNLLGAPAMSPSEFASYRPKKLLGVSLAVRGPTGQYDSSKLINIGTNRWSFKPEVGFVRVMGRWAVDAYVGGWFFTDNTDFFGGATRQQDPILSTQVHLRRAFGPKLWAAVDANFWWGGQTTINGFENDDEQRNSRVGLTVVTRFGRNHTLRFAVSTGAVTRIGGDFESIGAAYAYSWTRPK
jgi:hypothetical protein